MQNLVSCYTHQTIGFEPLIEPLPAIVFRAEALMERLPAELQIMVMENLDPTSLCSLLEAAPSVLTQVYSSRFEMITRSSLQHFWPDEELSQYLYAIVLAKHRGSIDLYALTPFLEFHFDGTYPRRLADDFPRSLECLQAIAYIFETIEFFVGFCADLFLMEMPVTMQQAPLSSGERFRLARALLRFQLYCQLFHQPGGVVDEFSSDWDWERRYLRQFLFWTRLERVEIEECKCVYLLLHAYLQDLGPLQVGAKESATNICSNGSSWRKMRGLPILRRIIEEGEVSLSAFNVSYAQSFQNYVFSGLHELDPSDASSISPTSSWNFTSRRWERLVSIRVTTNKRYSPSDASREFNFDVARQSCSCGSWHTRLDHSKHDWRLAGYCFWDAERVAGFETHRCSGCRHYTGPRSRTEHH